MNVYINVKNTTWEFSFLVLARILFLYLCLNTEERGEEAGDSDRGEVLGGEVPVQPLELVEGQEDAEQVDHDPERVQDVMPVWTLQTSTFIAF